MGDIKYLLKEKKIKSLYKGLLPTLWRDVPFSSIYWLCLEHFQIMFENFYQQHNTTKIINNESKYISLCNTFVSGAISGMIAATITTPFDVVKTRQQISNSKERTLFQHLKYIYRTEGFVNGLMRGNTTRVIKVAPACAIMISCYEFGKMVF